jgi:hypothetical protein
MIRKLFLALPLLLLSPFVSAQTIVSDPQLEATTASINATQTQILQQLLAIHTLLLDGQASITPAQRTALNAEMARALAAAPPSGNAPANSILPGNPAASTSEVAASRK